MDDHPKPAEKLVDVSREELLFDLESGMKYQDGKARQRAAVDAAVATVARMVAAQLERAGYVIKRKPPASGHSTPGSRGYKLQKPSDGMIGRCASRNAFPDRDNSALWPKAAWKLYPGLVLQAQI